MGERIVVQSAPRPATKDEEDKAYIDNIVERLGHSGNEFLAGYFVECDSCRAKPGSPSLCAGCLANRYNMSESDKKK